MNKQLLTFVLLICTSLSFSQSPPYHFQSLFGNPQRQEVIWGITKFNDAYLTLTLNDSFPAYQGRIDLNLFDDDGTVLNSKTIRLPGKHLIISPRTPIAVKKQDTTAFIVGRVMNAAAHGMLWKIDKNLDTLWHKEYSHYGADTALRFSCVLLVDDGIIIGGSSNQYNINGDCFLMKTDFNGNELWRRTDHFVNQGAVTLKIIRTFDKSFVAYQNVFYPASAETDYRIVKYDSLFNQIWAETYPSPKPDYEGDLIEASDSNYVLCNGYTDVMLGGWMGTPQSRNSLRKINKNNGWIIWEKKYGTSSALNYLHKLHQAEDGTIIALGSHVTPYVGSNPTGAYVPHVMSFTPNGDSLSYQTIFADSSALVSRLFGICETGRGYFFVGDATDPSIMNAQNWIIRSDSNLCFLDYCDYTSLPDYAGHSGISMYPNPAQHAFTLSTFNNIFERMRILDIVGHVVLQQKIEGETNVIDISSLPNGVYIVQLESGTDAVNTRLVISR